MDLFPILLAGAAALASLVGFLGILAASEGWSERATLLAVYLRERQDLQDRRLAIRKRRRGQIGELVRRLDAMTEAAAVAPPIGTAEGAPAPVRPPPDPAEVTRKVKESPGHAAEVLRMLLKVPVDS